MLDYKKFADFSPTDYADGLRRDRFMDHTIGALWPNMTRISGSAYTVEVPAGDSLMMHAAIYDAPAGAIIVVQTNGSDVAVAGGNVCAIAQKHGVLGFIIDGLIRDIVEIRELQFPVYAKGIIPKPSDKKYVGPVNPTVVCGGVVINTGDVIVADEEGIAVIPLLEAEQLYIIARHRAKADLETNLNEWEATHHAKVRQLLLK
ncbi:MAG: 4-hydroxy-4-methyl-2-oxoglutarate aldolase [Pseudohongiellaceae bacterium]|jgi:4-hydroxy-4-methyl-2-oxoglutarate aldolase